MAAKVGDTVEVPGGMTGIVKFVGPVDGKNGTFAGVQLAKEFAPRGKNSGEVEGKHYFKTTIPGSGIFLPVEKAVKKAGAATPGTPKTGGLSNFNQGGRTPLASLPKPNFSQSIGPGARASSPAVKPGARRESLPRPSSPLRKTQNQVQTPVAGKLTTPKTRPSIGLAKSNVGNGPQYRGSPSLSLKSKKLGQSLRQSGVTPSKKALSPLGPEASFDEEADNTPTPTPAATKSIEKTMRDEEIKRLKASLDQRDTQLKEQASSIADMEKSLAELSSMLPDQPPLYTESPPRGGYSSQGASELREALREKNEKIKMLTTEFDANRADFRSTIDTLEMASSETERVYEKRVDELLEEVRNLQDRSEDVEGVAQQFKQLEELVQELEEGLEEARRGEAEARGEVEFLRGEVERGRSELRREREKKRTERALNGEPEDEDEQELLHQVEQKDDEIRGLKAIIHSLNQGTSPHANGHINGNGIHTAKDSHLHAQIKTLETFLEQKSEREEELTRELSRLQSSTNVSNFTRFPTPPTHRTNTSITLSEKHRSAGSKNSNRLSDRTVVPSASGANSDSRQSWHDANEDVMNSTPGSPAKLGRVYEHDQDSNVEHADVPTTPSMRSEASSGALWCEICETNGHDILTCKNMFGANAAKPAPAGTDTTRTSSESHRSGRDVVRKGLQDLPDRGLDQDFSRRDTQGDSVRPAPLVSRKSNNSNHETPKALLPNPMDTAGMVAGKSTGVVDTEKWCALCERDGHESVDCPFEDAF